MQPDDIVFVGILFGLPIVKICLFCQEGKKVGSNSAPIYATMRFKDVLREIGNAVMNVPVFRSLIFERIPLSIKHMMALK